ncbi:MAG: YggS family pyridoxal phosphate enzyme [Acidimicrobiales bacterium]
MSPPTPLASPAPTPDDVRARLGVVRGRIVAAGGDPARVRVVAVTKGFGPEAARAVVEAGIADLGENYADELVAKALDVGGSVRWHFLGAVQRNKVRRLAPSVGLWQGVDRLEEGEAIARAAPGAQVLVEVDVTGAPGRGGVEPGSVGQLVDGLCHLGLDVRGLMTVAPAGDARAGEAFALVARLVADLGLAEASMGMSDDLEDAVANGSTMVRIGRALLGPRPRRASVPQ